MVASDRGRRRGRRLLSNLILTRLSVPETFGIMVSVTVSLLDIILFSDMGNRPTIMHSKRGADPDVPDKARTLQILRGAVFCLAACA